MASKKKFMTDEDFGQLLQSANEMTEILQGKRSASRVIRVKAPGALPARIEQGIARADLALMLGVSARTIENWEQGRRRVPRMARIILNIAKQNPMVLEQASRNETQVK
jgi:putative transcriptional regulator